VGYELKLGADDVARVRFAVSPLWETTQALRSVIDPRQRPYHVPWFAEIRPRLAELDTLPLLAIQPLRGYTPDLITPSPEHPRPSAREQLEQLRATPLSHVRAELERAVNDRNDEPMPAEMIALARHPKRARARLADALEACWEVLVEPYWPRINDLLAADIAHHSRLLAEHGLERLFPALHPSISWRDRTVRVARDFRETVRYSARGRGLLLQPSAFSWPRLVVVTDEPYQPTIVYPARGVAELWQPTESPTDEALATLLGRTRAMLLASVREPASTTTLARRHELAPATVSQHLAAMTGAGLIAASRNGRAVLYATTSLGEDLLTSRSGRPRPLRIHASKTGAMAKAAASKKQ
jgi:DNA-binding transcriptional ArsR family regulator